MSLSSAILQLPYAVFEEHVVYPVLVTICDILEELPKIFLLYWPKFSHLSPHQLPLEVVCDGLLAGLKRESTEPSDSDEDDDSLALFVASAWIEANMPVYEFVAGKLRELVGNFEEVSVLDHATSLKLADEMTANFTALTSYLFCVLSSVRLDVAVALDLRARALGEFAEMQQEVIDLQRSCEALEQGGKDATPSPSHLRTALTMSYSFSESPQRIRFMLSRSLEDATRPRSNTASSRRRGWQLMSMRDLEKRSGSHLHGRVRTGERRGWLEKPSKVRLVESVCNSPALIDQSAWKKRWVVVEAGKCSYFRDEIHEVGLFFSLFEEFSFLFFFFFFFFFFFVGC